MTHEEQQPLPYVGAAYNHFWIEPRKGWWVKCREMSSADLATSSRKYSDLQFMNMVMIEWNLTDGINPVPVDTDNLTNPEVNDLFAAYWFAVTPEPVEE